MATKSVSVTINGRETVSDASTAASGALGGFASKIPSWAAVTAGLAAAFAAISSAVGKAKEFVLSSITAFDEYSASQRKLEGTAKLSGIALSSLRDVADEGRTAFKLSTVVANDFSSEIGKLTSKSGDITKSKDAMAAFLDIGAARGLSAADTLKAVQQAVLGIDEGTDKLFGKNPSVLYEEYADKIGKSAGKLTDQEKAQALLDATLTGGDAVRGAYLEYLDSAAGQQEQLNNKVDETKVQFGAALQPVRTLVLQGLNKLLEVLGPVVLWLGNAANAAGVTVAKAFNGMKIAVGDVVGAFGRLTGNKELAQWGKDLSAGGRKAIEDIDAMVAKLATSTKDKSDEAETVVKKVTKTTADELKAQEKEYDRHVQQLQAWWKLLDDSVVKYKDVIKTLQPEIQKAMQTQHIQVHNDALKAAKENADALIAKMKQSADIPRDVHAARDAVGELGGKLSDASDEALKVVGQFGDFDDSAKNVLTSVKNIGDTVGALAKSGLSFAGVTGLVAGVATIVSSMMQGDAARRELLKQNNLALAKLSNDIGGLNLNITGEQLGKARTALSGMSFEGANFAAVNFLPALTQALEKQGLTLGDLRRIGEEIGIKIFDKEGRLNALAVKQLSEALTKVNPGRLGDSFSDQLSFFQQGQDIDGASGTLGGVGGLLDFLRNVGGVSALGGLDATDPTALRASLRTLLTQLNNGQGVEGLGRLTGSQFMQVLVQMIGVLDNLKAATASDGATTGGGTSGLLGDTTTAGGVTVPTETIQAVIKAMDTNVVTVLREHTTLHERIAKATEGSYDELVKMNGKMDTLIATTAGGADRVDRQLAEIRSRALANAGRGPEF